MKESQFPVDEMINQRMVRSDNKEITSVNRDKVKSFVQRRDWFKNWWHFLLRQEYIRP